MKTQFQEADYAACLKLFDGEKFTGEQIQVMDWLQDLAKLIPNIQCISLNQQIDAQLINVINQQEERVQPTYIFKSYGNFVRSVEQGNSRQYILAFHGTALENLHSILHNGGLCQQSHNSRLKRHGSAFGEGIYLSTHLATAFSFTQPNDGYKGSKLGERLRCVLVCYVNPQATTRNTPDKYILVKDGSQVELAYLLLYKEHRSNFKFGSLWIWVLAYVLLLVITKYCT
eukprot:TRINITY_DN8124_c0_g1_i2.p1 TRINITY_DN8124_c0_g1~~TRINITY_DN8124_c0_g1_i2.p1  ORF type:complete len:229 (+),score=11.45 TRINITY_DN8124_c0_g1_i2:215-901(+)